MDGVELRGCSEAELLAVFRGADTIGAPCALRVRRRGEELPLEVARTSAAALQASEAMLDALANLGAAARAAGGALAGCSRSRARARTRQCSRT